MDSYQYRNPFGEDLRDSVTLAGKTFSGTRARVYWLLEITRQRNYRHRVGHGDSAPLAPPGWVPQFLVHEPWSGGSEGKRRLRELRLEYGCEIEMQHFEGSSTTLYRLTPATGGAAGPGEACRHTPSPATRFGASRAQPPTAALPKEPLAGVRFWAVPSDPGANVSKSPIGHAGENGGFSYTSLQVDPGSDCPLAPSYRLLRWIERGERDAVRLDEAYRSELLAAFHAGDLTQLLAGRGDVVLWCSSAEPWNPLPTLTYALSRLGASHQQGPLPRAA